MEARLTSGLPRGQELTFTLDGDEPRTVKIGRKGKAEVTWDDLDAGVHRVRVEECDLEEAVNCCD